MPALLALLLLAGCPRCAPAPPRPSPVGPPARNAARGQHLPAIELRVGGRPVRAEVARTDPERHTGLMFRRDLGESEGMLFVFADEDFRAFWMHDTPLPLSIAYVARDGRITQISDMQPLSDETTPSREAVPYALEMHQGWFRAAGVHEGDRVEGLDRAPPASE